MIIIYAVVGILFVFMIREIIHQRKLSKKFGHRKGKGLDFDYKDWDVSNVKDIAEMFKNCETFNGDISKWEPKNKKK